MSAYEAAMAQMKANLQAIADAIWAPLLPHFVVLAEELHVVFFEMKPWWKRWWHTMTGHRNGRMLP